MTARETVAIKAYFEGQNDGKKEIRCFLLDKNSFKYSVLKQKVARLFAGSVPSVYNFLILWQDADKDFIPITSDEDFLTGLYSMKTDDNAFKIYIRQSANNGDSPVSVSNKRDAKVLKPDGANGDSPVSVSNKKDAKVLKPDGANGDSPVSISNKKDAKVLKSDGANGDAILHLPDQVAVGLEDHTTSAHTGGRVVKYPTLSHQIEEHTINSVNGAGSLENLPPIIESSQKTPVQSPMELEVIAPAQTTGQSDQQIPVHSDLERILDQISNLSSFTENQNLEDNLNEQSYTEEYIDGPVEHVNIVCDNCDGRVVGYRYKCIMCADFDLCANCEGKGVHSTHVMVRIPNPNMGTNLMSRRMRRRFPLIKYALKEMAGAASNLSRVARVSTCGNLARGSLGHVKKVISHIITLAMRLVIDIKTIIPEEAQNISHVNRTLELLTNMLTVLQDIINDIDFESFVNSNVLCDAVSGLNISELIRSVVSEFSTTINDVINVSTNADTASGNVPTMNNSTIPEAAGHGNTPPMNANGTQATYPGAIGEVLQAVTKVINDNVALISDINMAGSTSSTNSTENAAQPEGQTRSTTQTERISNGQGTSGQPNQSSNFTFGTNEHLNSAAQHVSTAISSATQSMSHVLNDFASIRQSQAKKYKGLKEGTKITPTYNNRQKPDVFTDLDEKIQQLYTMGFVEDCAVLTRLLTENKMDVNKVIDILLSQKMTRGG